QKKCPQKRLFEPYLINDTMLKGFSKYLDDPKFVDWIVSPTEEKDIYWERFMVYHPEEKQKIVLLRECLAMLKTKDDTLSVNEKEEILDVLYHKINLKKKSPRIIQLNFLKYAAVTLILAGLGLYMSRDAVTGQPDEIETLLQVSVDSVVTTKLVLSNAEEIHIEDKKSEVSYSTTSNLVINQKDTITVSNTSGKTKPGINQLIVPFGKHSKLTLEDGSIVHLNAGSRLLFPEKFVGNQREVYLAGEAFFEVESDKSRPFIVRILKDDTFSVEAVGTKFNINSYERHQSVTTVLTEGKVYLRDDSKTSFFTSAKRTPMQPGELAEWNVTSKAIVAQNAVDTTYYTSWINGILIFQSERLGEIIARISAYYNVKIRLSDEVNAAFRLTGKLDMNESLERTMGNLAVTTSMNYKKTADDELLIFK
ncbi:MAG: FecR domain-containing protein, partial [Bacteroidota bacterium]